MKRPLLGRILERLPKWAQNLLIGLIMLPMTGAVTVLGYLYPVTDAWQDTVAPFPATVSPVTQYLEVFGVTITWVAFVVFRVHTIFDAFREACRELRE